MANVHFPSQEAIVSYLQGHALTSNPYLTEKRIIETVAGYFANQEKAPLGINLGVMLALHDLNERLQLPGFSLNAIQLNLTTALMDCAREA